MSGPLGAGPLGVIEPPGYLETLNSGSLDLRAPDAIADERTNAFLDILRWSMNVDLKTLLVYRLQSADIAVLLPLAWQDEVMGRNGWDYVTTTDEKRELVRNAVQRQRHRGTPRAIKDALAVFGFSDVIVEDQPGVLRLDGTWTLNGRYLLDGGKPWPLYVVALTGLNFGMQLTADQVAEVDAICRAWQNARSRLKVIDVRLMDYISYGTVPNIEFCNYFGVGTNGVGGDVPLTNAYRRLIANKRDATYHGEGGLDGVETWEHTCELRADEANGKRIREFGLYINGFLLFRRVLGSGFIDKTARCTLSFKWYTTIGAI